MIHVILQVSDLNLKFLEFYRVDWWGSVTETVVQGVPPSGSMTARTAPKRIFQLRVHFE